MSTELIQIRKDIINVETDDHLEPTAWSDGISEDSLEDDDELNMNKNELRITDNEYYQKKHFYKKHSHEVFFDSHKRKQWKLRKSVSCSFCALCECSEFILNEDDIHFPIRKAASCSMCDWDFEETVSVGKISNVTEEDSIPSLNHALLQSTPLRLPNSSMSSTCSSESEDNENVQNNKNVITPETSEEMFSFVTPNRRRNSYKAAQGEDDFSTTVEDDNLRRSSPDGEEYLNKEFITDINFNRVEHHDNVIFDKDSKNKTQKNIISKQKTSSKKKFSFKRSKKKTSATKEFDEIFGKVQFTPQSSLDNEEQDEFNSTGELYNLNSFNITDDHKINLKSKKAERFFNRLLPHRRSLFNKKNYNLNVNKSKSVEVLYTDQLIRRNDGEREHDGGFPQKALSTLDISSGNIYCDREDEEEEMARHVNEKWISYLNKIDGMAILGSNPTLRYIWHQIACYQNELLQYFEDFLKTMIDELQQAYMKCQDLELLISDKNEKQEKATARLYDDVEQTIQQERLQMHEEQHEREENIRIDMTRVIEMKIGELQEITRQNNEILDTNERLRNENEDLRQIQENDNKQIKQLMTNENQQRVDNDNLLNVNSDLRKELKDLDRTVRELQDHIININKISEVEKENYQQCLRQYQDMLEEKEYLDINVKNITAELNDLKCHNKSLVDQISCNNSNFNSPCATPNRPYHNDCMCEAEDFEFDEKEIDSSMAELQNYHHSSPYAQVYDEATSKLQLTIGENGEVKNSHDSLMKPLKQSKQVVPLYRKPSNSVKSPIRFASSNQSEFKVIFTGDANVGKTSLIRRIHSGKFRLSREATIEADYYLKTVYCNGKSVALKLWDTLGQERFKSIPPSYFRRSDVVILMYDIVEEVSFLNAKQWIKTIHDHTDENIFLILVANKTDMHHKRCVHPDRGKKLASRHDAIFIETSAKSGENIDELSTIIANTLLERDDTLIIRNDFENSLCSMSYSLRKHRQTSCCQ